MDVWKSKKYKKKYGEKTVKKGIKVEFDNRISDELKKELIVFCNWVNRNYNFPIAVKINFFHARKIEALDGELVDGTFFGPYDFTEEPDINISVGEYNDILDASQLKKKELVYEYYWEIAHELTHYFQWVNYNKKYFFEEMQADRCATKRVKEFYHKQKISNYKLLIVKDRRKT